MMYGWSSELSGKNALLWIRMARLDGFESRTDIPDAMGKIRKTISQCLREIMRSF